MGRESRANKTSFVLYQPTQCHTNEYFCPRCNKCLICEHTQLGTLPERYWVCCHDKVKIWINSDRTFKEII